MVFYNKLKDIFEDGEPGPDSEREDKRSLFLPNFNQNWFKSQKFQKLMFSIEIKRNLEKSKLETEYKIKELEKKNNLIKTSIKKKSVMVDQFVDDEYEKYNNKKFQKKPKKNKILYIQQNLIKQKNLINRLKLSLLTIFKNMHMDAKHLNDNKYDSIDIEEVKKNSKKFISNCVYEKQIFENMKKEFKGKADFEKLYKVLNGGLKSEESDKENEIDNLDLDVVGVDKNSFLTQSPRSTTEHEDITANL